MILIQGRCVHYYSQRITLSLGVGICVERYEQLILKQFRNLRLSGHDSNDMEFSGRA